MLNELCEFYLLDIALNVEWQVEEELEALQHVERVACGVGFVFPPQDLLEKSVCGITRSYERETERGRVSESEGTGTKTRNEDTVKINADTTLSTSGFPPALSLIRQRDELERRPRRLRRK